MPFTPVAELLPDPSVRVFFSGLLILEPSQDGATCEVFVNRSAPNHQLTIELRRKRAGKPDFIMMRHIGPLAYGLATPGAPPNAFPVHGVVIQAFPTPRGVRKYEPGNPSTEGEGLSLAIDMEVAPFHNADIGAVDQLGGRPSIFMDDGIFYTADKTPDTLTTLLKKGGAVIQELPPFANLIGANLYLEQGDTVSIRWRQQGRIEGILLQKPEPGTSYELSIVNDPLYETDSTAVPVHDEFREYYKILPEVPTQDQFSVEFPTPPPTDTPASRGSSRAPCMSVIKGG